MATVSDHQFVADLVASRKPGYSLPGAFYSDARIYCAEIERIWRSGWLVSETMEGKQVAPLMGDYTEPDVGTLRIRTMPNLWNHSSCDHDVSTRLLPAGPRCTLVRVTWLVDSTAIEGCDYQLEEIMPFWQLTSEQDWAICERAQRGVESSRYLPGPFSTHKEYNVDGFVRWYLQQLSGA